MTRERTAFGQALVLMLLSTVGFALMAVTIRLASQTEPTWEVAFFRNVFGLVTLLAVLAPGVLRARSPATMARETARTRQLPRYLLRSAIGIGSMFCNFWAVKHLPLAQAIALVYSSPIFVTVAAIFMLGEKVRLRRWLAVILGFVGVLIIVRPWSSTVSFAAMVAVAAAVFNALVAVQIKQLAAVDPPDTIVLWTYLFWVPMSMVPALMDWHAPHGIAWVWLGLSGVLGTMGQVLWTRALRLGDVSALTPLSFLQMPIVAVIGWWLFAERLDMWTATGALVIFASIAYIAHRESQLARRHASIAPTEAAEPGN